MTQNTKGSPAPKQRSKYYSDSNMLKNAIASILPEADYPGIPSTTDEHGNDRRVTEVERNIAKHELALARRKECKREALAKRRAAKKALASSTDVSGSAQALSPDSDMPVIDALEAVAMGGDAPNLPKDPSRVALTDLVLNGAARVSAIEGNGRISKKTGDASKLVDLDALTKEPEPPVLPTEPTSPSATDVFRKARSMSNHLYADAALVQGATHGEINRLLKSLNINVSLRLSRNDTANLLACLLTCNETQLNALYENRKVPVAIKTIIKRLLEDLKLGNTETVEKLWDRIFGKGQMQVDLPQQAQLESGILPNTPVSREAYVIIRDTLLK